MKFTDIPKFTQTSPYHADHYLDYLDKFITEEETESNLQLNPDFQRGHVWTREQQIAYVEYLLQGGTSGREIYFNHPGWMGDWKGEYVCVDGLQRLTACLKFVRGELPVFGYLIHEFEDRLRMADVHLSINVNNLKTRREVLVWYLEMNTGGTIHTDEEINKVKLMLNETK